MQNHRKPYLVAVRHILQYVKGASDFGIIYKSGVSCKVAGFCEDDYAIDIAIHKFTTRYVLSLGSKAISWCSKQQATVSL